MAKNTAFTKLPGDDYDSQNEWLKQNRKAYEELVKAKKNQLVWQQLRDKHDVITRDINYYNNIQAHSSTLAEQETEKQKRVNHYRAIALNNETDPLKRASITIMTENELVDHLQTQKKSMEALAKDPTNIALTKLIEDQKSPRAGYDAGYKLAYDFEKKQAEKMPPNAFNRINEAFLNKLVAIPLKMVTAPAFSLIGDQYSSSFIYGLLDGHREIGRAHV